MAAKNFSKSLNIINQNTKLGLMKYVGNSIMKFIVVVISHKFKDFWIVLKVLHELLKGDGDISVEEKKHELFQRDLNSEARLKQRNSFIDG